MDTSVSISPNNPNNSTFLVYKHTNLLNGKVYIGITKCSPNRRWCNGSGYKRNAHFWSAIQKTGWDNFSHEILAEGLSEEEALSMEESLIKKYNSTNREKGYNRILSSLKSHSHFTEEDKIKIGSSVSKYHENLDEEGKKEFRRIHKECSNTPSAKLNMSLGQKRRFKNETVEEKEIRRRKHKEASLRSVEKIRENTQKKLDSLTEEDWKRRGDAIRRGLSTPEAKKHMSEGHKRGLNTPEALERKEKKKKIYNDMKNMGKFQGPHSWNEFSKWYSKNKESL